MSVSHGMRSFRALGAAIAIGLVLSGCGGPAAKNAPAGTDPKLGQRRQEMSDFMKGGTAPNKSGTAVKP